MMSLQHSKLENYQAATRAAVSGLQPFVVEETDLRKWRKNPHAGMPFPFIGHHCPEGWHTLSSYELDLSNDSSLVDFIDRLVVGSGYAVTNIKHLWIVVTEFKRH